MSVEYFEGPAGTGKTTAIIQRVVELVRSGALREDQRILALSFMHGARRRLLAKLEREPELQGKYECLTIDSYAWRIIHRWRSLLRALGVRPSTGGFDFDSCVASARVLLERSEVRRWVAATFPIVVVDEMQDCRGDRLGILQALSIEAKLIAAADEFQDLSGEIANAAVDWLRRVGTGELLDTCHRTSDGDLLRVARLLRDGQLVTAPIVRPGIKVVQAFSSAMAASAIGLELLRPMEGDTVLLSPVRAETDPFVAEVVDLLTSGRARAKKRCLPRFPITWDSLPEDEVNILCNRLDLTQDMAQLVPIATIFEWNGHPLIKDLQRWVMDRYHLTGQASFTVSELQAELFRIAQWRRAYSGGTGSGVKAMTIHQAKNREFSRIILLWPYRVPGDSTMKRRLVYNALTRARTRALVVVRSSRKGVWTYPFSGGIDV